VLLRFQEQVKAGGPVTVTDPNIKRFFMLIPEAVELVLHAASVGRGGDTLILDMGEQVRVLDLARNVIRLAGHVPDKDIPIVFTGLRPGEKLYEELVGDRESLEPSPVDKILRIASEGGLAPAGAIPDLERHAVDGSTADVIHLLSTIVPTFRSNTADAGAATPSAADHTASRPAAADDDGTLAPSLASDQLSLP
jgi:FlaA1/EpsC-like NDP-sugar epimerase